MASMAPGSRRVWSVSSTRTMNRPPWLRAKSQLKRAVRMFPKWGAPVGLGA